MKLHRNAKTCPHSRRLLVARVEREGWSIARAGEALRHQRPSRGQVARTFPRRW
jgi:hypothetical protein